MRLRIHHFFDIIRDIGKGKTFTPHPYYHSYHKVAIQILENPELKLIIVTESDNVCNGCIHLAGKMCDDIITHRKDFTSKENFNNFLDERIIEVCGIDPSVLQTPRTLCLYGKPYLDNIFYIYEGNDISHTETRRRDVANGLREYAWINGFA